MSRLWEANLQALAGRPEPPCQSLWRALSGGPCADLGLRSRQGEVLAGRGTPQGARALKSTFDATREAQRWAADVDGGTVAVWGAAGGELALALFDRGVRLQFWVDPRLEVWRSLFTWEDCTPWLADPRWLPVAEEAHDWARTLLERYHPLWDGSFFARDWRTSTQGEEERWDEHRRASKSALETLSSDASTQARFAERWYRNTLVNLRQVQEVKIEGCTGREVVVAGAGPGLDDALASAQERAWLDDRSASGNRLFATDTALPALSAQGVVPDLVFCLDGQLPSYHHFVASPPPVPLVADLASLPLLGRRGMPVIRYLSGHPFGAVIRRVFPEIPSLDTSLGNVSGLALLTARALGARSVRAWGADFSYREGQSYAHGTYVYDLAGRRSHRLSPLETRLSSSCYGAAGLVRTKDARGRSLDTTPLLRDYRRRWDGAPSRVLPVRLEHGAAGARWEQFADHWRKRLESLPLPPRGVPVRPFVSALEPSVRQDWLALWPLGLALHRQGVSESELPAALVARALSFLQD